MKEHVFSMPINISDFTLPISISVGMAAYDSDTNLANKLLEYADFAMCKAKRKGKNRAANIYDQKSKKWLSP